MVMVPKGPRANVSDIGAAREKRARGRPSGLGYDPSTGEEVIGPTLERQPGEADPESQVFAAYGKQLGYSEDRFYTKSSDQRGHSQMLRVWLPQGIDAQVYAAVNDIPQYRTVQDFVRDAIVHRLEYLQKRYKISKAMQRLLDLERSRAESERRSAEVDTMTAAIDEVAAALTKTWEAGDYALFAQEIDEAEALIDQLRDPYQQRLSKMVGDWKRRGRDELERIRQQMDE